MSNTKKDNFAKEVGKRIKFYRNLRGYTLVDMDNLTDFSAPYISYIENSINIPSSFAIWQIANTLNVPFESLLPGGENAKLTSENEFSSNEKYKPYLKIVKKAIDKNIDPKKFENVLEFLINS